MKLRGILYSTLLGEVALMLLLLFLYVFDNDVKNALNEDWFFHITYPFLYSLPFLTVLFFTISVLVQLARKVAPKVPVVIIPFIFSLTGLLVFSIYEPYFKELEFFIYVIISSLVITLCSLPVLR